MKTQTTLGSESMFRSRQERTLVFFFVFVGVTALTYAFLYLIDFLPEKPQDDAVSVVQAEMTGETVPAVVATSTVFRESTSTPASATTVADIDSYPVRVIFDDLNRSIPVLNPNSTDSATLDRALLSGVVRHPASADFAQTGTIFLFGHSSYLPNVINKNFQAFNGIQNLTWGDRIRLQSTDTEYVYRVDRVYQVKASEAEVAIERGTAKLTLVTCNSFGSKDDRYIVEATLIETHTL